jgi:predicted CopG family antitoxin
MFICTHMTSKNISITEDVYNKLLKVKREDESFSELFLRLLKIQKIKLEQCFGAWNLSKEEKKEIWGDITNRTGRHWTKPDAVT